jgi:DNA-binding NarL/FixJ family response regulator
MIIHTGPTRGGATNLRARQDPAGVRAKARRTAIGPGCIGISSPSSTTAEFTAGRAIRDAGEYRLAVLTQHEREVLALVAHGLTNDEIATRLILSPATARTHVSRAMVKLGARDRAQLVVIAYQTGLVSPATP